MLPGMGFVAGKVAKYVAKELGASDQEAKKIELGVKLVVKIATFDPVTIAMDFVDEATDLASEDYTTPNIDLAPYNYNTTANYPQYYPPPQYTNYPPPPPPHYSNTNYPPPQYYPISTNYPPPPPPCYRYK